MNSKCLAPQAPGREISQTQSVWKLRKMVGSTWIKVKRRHNLLGYINTLELTSKHFRYSNLKRFCLCIWFDLIWFDLTLLFVYVLIYVYICIFAKLNISLLFILNWDKVKARIGSLSNTTNRCERWVHFQSQAFSLLLFYIFVTSSTSVQYFSFVLASTTVT